MDKDKFIKELKKLLADKKVSTLLSVLLVLVFLLIAVNVFAPKYLSNSMASSQASSNNNNRNNVNIDDETAKANEKTTEEYETEQKKNLISILKKIEGVGEVDVSISYEAGEVKVPAYDTTNQTTTTEETDSSGGKRVSNQKNDGSTVVMTQDTQNGKEPVILQTYKPKVTGVLVVAEGAKNSKTKADIEKAVTGLYNITANKVNVYPMK